ncbi:MAG: hypothetical protein ABIG61_10610 [Planctomycetota bacterium]
MARGRLSPLYEAMSKSRRKTGGDKGSGLFWSKQKDGGMVKESGLAASWRKRPKLVLFNAGRVELSLPYPIAVTVVLVLLLVILGVFRLGQRSRRAGGGGFDSDLRYSEAALEEPTAMPAGGVRTEGGRAASGKAAVVLPEMVTAESSGTGESQGTGNNVIVLVEYATRAQLVPVRDYFASKGIETEIIAEGGRYFLVTKNRYQNPDKEGTDGYATKQKIIEAGRGYKAPEGYETFAPRLFSDAYGKKVK